MRIWLAIRACFTVLFDASAAQRVREALEGGTISDVQTKPTPAAELPRSSIQEVPRPQTSKPSARNDAVTLLATLQREARFLDIVQEPLMDYSDAQIGVAAREVLQNCATVLDRLFGLQPVLAEEEGSDINVAQGYDPLRYRLVGNVSGPPPFRGKLTHRGWMATRCELPTWSGNTQSANVIAPVEVEVE